MNISISSVPALIGAGICFLPMLWSKSIGTSSHCFYSTLSITIPVILIYSIWIPIYLLKRKTVFKIDAIDVLLCSYILFAALNTILHNKDINDAVITKWATFLSMYLTIRCLSNSKRILNVILYGLVCSALIQCIIYLVQKFLHSDVFFNPFSATAQFSNPGHLAAFLAVIFPLPLVLADQHTSKTIKWGFRISAALILASTLLTFSRGAFLAGFISFLLYFCTTKTKSSRIKKNLLIIIATAVYDSWFMDMLSAFVNYNIYNSPISSIDQGRMVLATMNGANNQGDGHCIVIVGYDAYHDYIFYDPVSGCLKQEDITSPITFVKYYTILSKKE